MPDSAKPAPSVERFTPSENAQDWVRICKLLNVRFTRAQISSWFSKIDAEFCEPYEDVLKRCGDEMLSRFIQAFNWEVRERSGVPARTAFRDSLIDYLHTSIGCKRAKPLKTRFPLDMGFSARTTPLSTCAKRSPNLDRPVERFLNEFKGASSATIVDIGVGYPPVTTTQTAKLLGSRARVIGVDCALADLLVRFPSDSHINYVVFYALNKTQDGFEPVLVLSEEENTGSTSKSNKFSGLDAEYRVIQAEEVRQQLMQHHGEQLYVRLAQEANAPLAPVGRLGIATTSSPEFWSRLGRRASREELIVQPTRRFAHGVENLEFRRDDFRLSTIARAQIIRFGNVLRENYYSSEEAHMALALARRKLDENGQILVVNDDTSSLTLEHRDGKLWPKRISVRAIYNTIIWTPSKLFPYLGEEFFDATIAVNLDAPSEAARHGPVSRVQAELSLKRLQDKKYRVSLERVGSLYWLDIDLSDRAALKLPRAK